jgi:RNA polymerase sigma-70 factor (ECF subfamily)
MSNVNNSSARFEEYRGHLLAVGYRMLGSLRDAESAVQDVKHLAGAINVDAVEDPRGWLTGLVGRVCLNLLRTRRSLPGNELVPIMPDPIVSPIGGSNADQSVLAADSVGIAVLVILDTVRPDERLAFVLHDEFAVPYRDIASILERSLGATRRLASLARQRVLDVPAPDIDIERQRLGVDAFFAAATDGDTVAIAAILQPDVVLRSDGGRARPSATTIIRGVDAVAGSAIGFAELAPFTRPALVNGEAGVVAIASGVIECVVAFTVMGSGIIAVNVLADSDRLDHIAADAWS